MIIFKTGDLEPQFDLLDERLRHIVFALAGFVDHEFGKDFIITSLYRDDAKSVHHWWRGCDFRIHQAGKDPYYSDEEISKIKRFCSRYEYNKDRYGINTLKVHGTPPHGHLQINDLDYTRIWREYDL
ncbi:MAG: hypothetical protein ACE5D7_00845 [Fidelibacterota bacterium]